MDVMLIRMNTIRPSMGSISLLAKLKNRNQMRKNVIILHLLVVRGKTVFLHFKLEVVIPPYNGWGDEDDISFAYRLIPTAPKKDYYKWMDSQGNLRYYAKLKTMIPEDIERRFIITFYLHDDTLLIYEPEQRNSGKHY